MDDKVASAFADLLAENKTLVTCAITGARWQARSPFNFEFVTVDNCCLAHKVP